MTWIFKTIISKFYNSAVSVNLFSCSSGNTEGEKECSQRCVVFKVDEYYGIGAGMGPISIRIQEGVLQRGELPHKRMWRTKAS